LNFYINTVHRIETIGMIGIKKEFNDEIYNHCTDFSISLALNVWNELIVSVFYIKHELPIIMIIISFNGERYETFCTQMPLLAETNLF
jgi:hypothetical protein